MLDIKLIRANREEVEQKIKTKDPEADLSLVCDLDQTLRELKTQADSLKSKRNEASKRIAELKRRGEDVEELIKEIGCFGDEVHLLDRRISDLEAQFTHELAKLPNLPLDGVKVSQKVEDNLLVRESGARPSFSFQPKNHLELNEKLHLFDFKRAAKVTGTGWPAYRGLGARLEWALINYMLEVHLKNGFELWMPPLAVKRETMFGSGQLPKFEHQLFNIQDKDYDFFLIPTAEVALNGLRAGEILSENELPQKYTAYTPCFRREAGAAGAQERGLIRMHQFNKVEMFAFAKPEESEAIFRQMVAAAEEVLQGLGLHYRTMQLVTGDMSFAAAETYDIEVWLPGQNRYYEVSSVSNCTDYQARRSDIRFKRGEGKPEFVHTLNGSGLATSRLMVALLENNQNEDGSIDLPPLLQNRLGGLKKLEP